MYLWQAVNKSSYCDSRKGGKNLAAHVMQQDTLLCQECSTGFSFENGLINS